MEAKPITLALVAVVSSACGLLYQQLMVKNLTGVVSDVLLVQTISLVIYLGALGVGSLIADHFSHHAILRKVAIIELILAFVGVLIGPLIHAAYFICKFFLHEIGGDMAAAADRSRLLFLFANQYLTVILGFCTGFEFSALIHAARRVNEKAQNWIIAANNLGALLACLTFAIVFGAISPTLAAWAVALVNFCVALLLIRMTSSKLSWRWLWLSAVGTSGLALIVFLIPNLQRLEQFYLKSLYSPPRRLSSPRATLDFIRHELLPKPDVIRIYTSYQTADFVTDSTGGLTMFLDNQAQLSAAWNKIYHESLVHMPIQFFGQVPRRVLILGGGDGIAARELLRYGDRIENIDLVELDPTIIQLAKENQYFLNLNEGALTHPKVTIHLQDAIAFLRFTSGRWDAIYADFPLPFDYDLLKLFSVEFYKLVAMRLAPGGTLTLDSGILNRVPDEWNGILLETLKAAGFQTRAPYLGNEVFVTARLDLKQPQTNFKDWGINFDYLNANRLAKALVVDLHHENQASRVNSIFRPMRRALRDFDF